MQLPASSVALPDYQLERSAVPGWSRMAILACMCSLLIPRGADLKIGTILIDYIRLTLTILSLMAARQVLTGKVQLRTTLADWFMLAHVGIVALSAFVHEGTGEGLEIAVGQVIVDMGLAYFVARVAIRNLQCYRYFVRIALLVAGISAAFGLIEMFTGYSPIRAAYHVFFPGVGVHVREQRLSLYRTSVAFRSCILFGMYCMVVFALAFHMKPYHLKMGRRLYKACIVLCVLGVFASLSSGPWMGFMFCLVCLAYGRIMRNIPGRWRLFISSAVMVFLFLSIFSNRGPIRILVDLTLTPGSGYVRLAMWDCVFALMPDYWPLGWGWTDDWPRAVEWYFFHSVDSFYAVNLLRSGIFSVLSIVGFLFYSWYKVSQIAGQDHLAANEAKGWILGTFFLFWTAITVHIFGSMVFATFFLLGAGQVLFTAYERRTCISRPV